MKVNHSNIFEEKQNILAIKQWLQQYGWESISRSHDFLTAALNEAVNRTSVTSPPLYTMSLIVTCPTLGLSAVLTSWKH